MSSFAKGIIGSQEQKTESLKSVKVENPKKKNLEKNIEKRNSEKNKELSKRCCFDVAVIGAGTAGSAVARYVSDDFSVSVVLLEQGRNEIFSETVNQPFGFSALQNIENVFAAAVNPRTTDILYNVNFLGGVGGVYDQNTFQFHAGNGNGGASNHCYLEAQRSTPGFQNFMSRFAGSEAANWNADGATKTYMEIETYGGPANTPYRGYTGPFNIFQNGGANSITQQILESGRLASNSPLDQALPISFPGSDTDYNNKVDLSLPTQFQYYLNPDFSREHSGNAFLGLDVLDPATGLGVGGRQLREIENAVVSRVIFHKKKGNKAPKVKGVEYIVNGEKRKVYCRRAIICAGALRSSTILERSGIGAKDILEKAGVKLVFENPNVGDHLNSGVGNGCIIRINPDLWETMLQVHMELKIVDTENPYPDWIRRFHVGHYPGTFPPVQPTNALMRCVGADLNGVNNVLSAGWNLQPTSFGWIHIIDANPNSMPEIYFPLINTEEDVRMQREYYKFMKRLEINMQTLYPDSQYEILYPPKEAYAGYPNAPEIVFTGSITDDVLTVDSITSGEIKLGMSLLAPGVPLGTVVQAFITGQGGVGTYGISSFGSLPQTVFNGDYLDMYAGSLNVLLDHYSSTCKMGDFKTQGGVVDGKLNVYGVRGLKVADNSIFPVQTDAGVLPPIMAGKKAAEYILKELR